MPNVLIHLDFAMNEVRFVVSPELHIAQGALTFDIVFISGCPFQ